MEDQRVKYETAILAQSKGFEEKGEDFYTTNKELCAYMFSFSNTYMCEAPNQGLLQKWLREVHNIHIESNLSWGLRYFFKVYKGIEDKYTTEDSSLYEEGLEIALKEGLKLIKNESN